jgi:PKD repeat protein
MNLRHFYSLLLFCVSVFFIFQDSIAQTTAPCATDQVMEQLFQQKPALYQLWQAQNKALEQKALQTGTSLNKTSEDVIPSYIFPVVVHVVHQNGVEKISRLRIKNQIAAMNRDFRKLPGTIGFGSGVDMNIEFCLATIDPNGQPTDGIVYVESPATNLGQFSDAQLKSVSRWDPSMYMNIYVVRNIGSDNGFTTLGYAFFPLTNDGNFEQDGIVVVHSAFGDPDSTEPAAINERTIVHEIGHWLSLAHPFQGGCDVMSCRSSGDNLCDTPPTAESNFGSPRRRNSCVPRIEAFGPDKPDQVRNYMDYADKEVADMFTAGQRERAMNVINEEQYKQRFPLWQLANHRLTGVGQFAQPTAYAWTDDRVVCAGQPVRFMNYSMNHPQIVRWEFPGGTPATSSEWQPQVVYSQPGTYSAKLIVENQVTGTKPDTFELKDFITVRPDTAFSLPFVEDFFAGQFPPIQWTVYNFDENPYKRTVKFNRGGRGRGNKNEGLNGSARMQFNTYSNYDQVDALTSPLIAIQGNKELELSFDVAYAPVFHTEDAAISPNVPKLPFLYTDTLSVFLSMDCGQSWQEVFRKGGEELATNRNFASDGPFIPDTLEDWRKEVINLSLSNVDSNTRVQLKFETLNGNGNNLYIDEVKLNVVNKVSRKPTQLVESSFMLFPNPVGSSHSQLTYTLQEATPVQYAIIDLNGRTIHQTTAQFHAAGKHTDVLPVLPAGVYAVQLLLDGQWLAAKKLIVLN